MRCPNEMNKNPIGHTTQHILNYFIRMLPFNCAECELPLLFVVVQSFGREKMELLLATQNAESKRMRERRERERRLKSFDRSHLTRIRTNSGSRLEVSFRRVNDDDDGDAIK